MSMQAHRIRSTWPLYLVIAIAGAASIATSPPPTWLEYRHLEGPTVTLDPVQSSVTIPFTVSFSAWQDWSDLELRALVRYEDADAELRVSVVEPGTRTLATQFQRIDGDGSLLLSIRAPAVSLRCGSPGDDPCAQDLAVVFATGGTRTGTFVIDWYLTALTGDDGSAPPEDLVFEVALEGGRPVDSIDLPSTLPAPWDEAVEGRWQLVAQHHAEFLVLEAQAGHSLHVTVRSMGPYTESNLFIPFWLSYGDPELERMATFRIAVLSDDPAAAVVAEHVASVSGGGHVRHSLSIPLDCAPETVCERGFTIIFDGEDEDELLGYSHLYFDIDALLEGEGDVAPAEARIEILPDVPDQVE